MPGPANSGFIVYAFDVALVAQFYETLLGMRRLHQTADMVVLENADIQLIVHAVPPEIRSGVTISKPPEPRRKYALKFFVTVSSLAAARGTAATLGGELFSEQWNGPGFVVCNAMDPEGNMFHVRERAL
jgi:predicted enzyme related to lactoylglutathione lyase